MGHNGLVYRRGRKFVSWQKRLLDILLACIGIIVFAIPFLFLLLVLLFIQGRPIFYVSERMKSPDQGFKLLKLRSMRASRSNSGVTGGDKDTRYTKAGRVLRKYRLDELPQILNVLKGDMSFVGPRPPLRGYVESFPEVYGDVLKSKPGITGLATLVYHGHETELLAKCKTAQETDAVYRNRCIPVKARLDLMYQQQQSVCFDLSILGKTIAKLFPKL